MKEKSTQQNASTCPNNPNNTAQTCTFVEYSSMTEYDANI